MNRYLINSNNVTNRYDGKRVFKTTKYPVIPLNANDIYLIATEGDYLDTLALKYYKDSTLWWVIAQANGIKGTMMPKPGKQIRIPGNVSDIIAKFSRANS